MLVGLFGELWFLVQWAGPSAGSVQAWEASDGARHDFQWPQYSVEVKATSRSGPIVHSIQISNSWRTLRTGDLYLYSLRVARDALAANTVTSLVRSLVNAGTDQSSRRYAGRIAPLNSVGGAIPPWNAISPR